MFYWFIRILTQSPPSRLVIKRVFDWFGERGLIRKSLPPHKNVWPVSKVPPENVLVSITDYRVTGNRSRWKVDLLWPAVTAWWRTLPGYTRLVTNHVRSRCRHIGHRIIACRSRTDGWWEQAIDFAITKATGIHHRESYSANIIYGPLICTHPQSSH